MTTPVDPAQVVFSDQQNSLAVEEAAVRSVVHYTLQHEKADGRVEVVLVDDVAIADLHVRFMQVEGPTDVITFPMDDEDSPDDDLLGSIVVSTDTAIRQAPSYWQDPVLETLQYVVHGVLHLLGYDDLDDESFAVMAERQEQILEGWRRAQS